MSVVQGFGGMKIRDEELHFTPKLPAQWQGLSFSILWRGATLKATLNAEGMTIENLSGTAAKFAIDGTWFEVAAGETASTTHAVEA